VRNSNLATGFGVAAFGIGVKRTSGTSGAIVAVGVSVGVSVGAGLGVSVGFGV